ncbi:D-alanyl-D-alanine carboxypeptidase/D-alanyl-D-alanine-endopeptidase [Arcanobacterium hippocoleae]
MKNSVTKSRITIVSVLAIFGGYVYADVWDLVPGFFTLKDSAGLAQPYPQANPEAHLEPRLKSDNGSTRNNKSSNNPELQLPAADVNAPLPEKGKLADILQEFARNPEMNGQVSAVIADVATREVLAELNADRPATPASVNKLLTAAAVLSAYNPNTTFATETKFADGTLYLIAGGDVLLAADAGNEDAVAGHAGLGDLARETAVNLKQQKITAVDLVLDAALFADEDYAPGNDANIMQWVMAASPIAVNRNLDESGKFLPQPRERAVNIFAQHLQNAGIGVKSVNFARTPAEARGLARVNSAPLREIVDLTLLQSDNTLAETLGHLAAVKNGKHADFAGAGEAVRSELAKLGFSTAGTVLADSSGLSEANKLTAALVNQILLQIGNCDRSSCASLLSALPVSQLDGTLSGRFADLPVAGKVRAKTGSLGSVTSMAGLLYTNAGRMLSFVVIVDGVPEDGAYGLRPLLDGVIAKIIAA